MLEYAPKNSKRTQMHYKTTLGHSLPFFGSMRLTSITPKKIAEYKAMRYSKGVKPGTVNLERSMFSKEKARVRSLKTNLVFTNTVFKKIGISWVMKNFIIARGKAGLEDFHFHDLRHTFATRLAQRGVDLYTISKLLGHVNITMTQRYAHHCPESLRAGIAVLENSGHDLVTVGEIRNVSNG